MDWLRWIPTPANQSSRKAIEALRRKEAHRRKDKRHAVENHAGRPLVFQTSNDACVSRPAVGATLACPVLLGLGDGSPKHEKTPSLGLPAELLSACQHIAESQLQHHTGGDIPGISKEEYRGPIALLKEAYASTLSLGSTTVALAALDNSTVIHGQLHPMVAVLSLGGTELLQLRRRDFDKCPAPSSAQSPADSASTRAESQRSSTEHGSPASPEITESVSPAQDSDRSLESIELTARPEDPRGFDAFSNWPVPEDVPADVAMEPELPILNHSGHFEEGVLPKPTVHQETPIKASVAVAGEFEVVLRAPPKRQLDASAGETVVLKRDAMDSVAEMRETLMAIDTKSSVQCASARQGDILILVSAGLFADADPADFVALCNETLPAACEAGFSPTPPASLRALAQRISKVGLAVPGSVVVAEVVEWVDDTLASTTRALATPETRLDPTKGKPYEHDLMPPSELFSSKGALAASEQTLAEAIRMDSSCGVGRMPPVMEGLESMKTVHCNMGLGEYAVSFRADVPAVEVPKWPLRRTLTNDFICGFE